MIRFPIGDYFESLVRWLKDSLSGFFDAVSDILDFSITVLENTLLLDSEHLYASVLFGLVLALMAGLLGRRLKGPRFFLPALLGAAVVFAGVEYWRVKSLAAEVTPRFAAEVEENFSRLRAALEADAPEDYSAAEAVLEAVEEEIPSVDDRGSPVFEAKREVQWGLRDLNRPRSDFEDVYEALGETRMAVAAAGLQLPGDLAEELALQEARFGALALIDQSGRLIDDLREVSAGEVEELERRSDFINVRSYERLVGLVSMSAGYHRETGNEELVELSEQALADLRLKNPNRLLWFAPAATILLLALIAYLVVGGGVTVFTVAGLLIILSMGLWIATMETLALVLSATLFALVLGVPLGILAARSETADAVIRPVLDFMQTMPAFVYLIPAVFFFGLGKVPGAMATLIFAMPPAVRLTSLGIRQVPEEVVEAAESFGATSKQLLLKAQLPIAMVTILAGVNQTIMLALSMVVIGGMIGAGGLGEIVLSGITQMKLGLGFEAGIAVVILAIYLDRVTQALGNPPSKTKKQKRT